ncbi:hypothetical protein KUCAC02_000147, partial [Chaenocephalus aceratus]
PVTVLTSLTPEVFVLAQSLRRDRWKHFNSVTIKYHLHCRLESNLRLKHHALAYSREGKRAAVLTQKYIIISAERGWETRGWKSGMCRDTGQASALPLVPVSDCPVLHLLDFFFTESFAPEDSPLPLTLLKRVRKSPHAHAASPPPEPLEKVLEFFFSFNLQPFPVRSALPSCLAVAPVQQRRQTFFHDVPGRRVLGVGKSWRPLRDTRWVVQGDDRLRKSYGEADGGARTRETGGEEKRSSLACYGKEPM